LALVGALMMHPVGLGSVGALARNWVRFVFWGAIGFGRRIDPELGSFCFLEAIGFGRRIDPELGSFCFLGRIGFGRRFVRELGSFRSRSEIGFADPRSALVEVCT
jgi:hypothetical protein